MRTDLPGEGAHSGEVLGFGDELEDQFFGCRRIPDVVHLGSNLGCSRDNRCDHHEAYRLQPGTTRTIWTVEYLLDRTSHYRPLPTAR
jgi:hypothetical protein